METLNSAITSRLDKMCYFVISSLSLAQAVHHQQNYPLTLEIVLNAGFYGCTVLLGNTAIHNYYVMVTRMIFKERDCYLNLESRSETTSAVYLGDRSPLVPEHNHRQHIYNCR